MRIRYIGAQTMTGKSFFLDHLDLTRYYPIELDKNRSTKTVSGWNEERIEQFLAHCSKNKLTPVFAHRFVGKSVKYLKTIGELDCFYIVVSDEQYRLNVEKRLAKSGRILTEEYWNKVLKNKQRKDKKFLSSYYDDKYEVTFLSIDKF